jgi:hypothetical protein
MGSSSFADESWRRPWWRGCRCSRYRLDGKAWGDAVAVPFLYDIDAHARFLIALPLLIVAELVVHQRMRSVVAQFVTLKLVRGGVREQFDAAVRSAMRLRNSVLLRRAGHRDLVRGADSGRTTAAPRCMVVPLCQPAAVPVPAAALVFRVFVAPLSRARRAGLRDYGHVAKRHLDEFDAKWLHGGAPDGEQLLGNPDVSSLTLNQLLDSRACRCSALH